MYTKMVFFSVVVPKQMNKKIFISKAINRNKRTIMRECSEYTNGTIFFPRSKNYYNVLIHDGILRK